MLELWGMRSTPLLLSAPGPLWSGMVTPERVVSMGQIELNCVLVLNWVVWNRIVLPAHWFSGRVFANSPGDQGSMTGRVIPNTQKWYLMPPCLTLSIIRYVSRVKWINPRKGVAPSPTPRCSSYWKGSPRLWSPTLLYLFIFKLRNYAQLNCLK